tara:strand:+ start:401 stop:604 length:204 start_codon:yes stop_codon:yes gene_type:complete
MKPIKKSRPIEVFLDSLFDRTESITNNSCVVKETHEVNLKFRDDISKDEYRISGLCQTCQDEIFLGV